MKRVEAEFTTPSRPGRWHWAAMVVLAVLSAGQATRVVMAQLELRELQREISSLEAQIAAVQATPPRAPVPPYDASAREMLRERDTTWMETLTALESVGMQGVVVTSINMPAPGNPITVQLTVSDYRTLMEYLTALNGSTVEAGALRFELQQARSEGTSGHLLVIVLVTKGAK